MENDCELLPIMLNRKTDRKRNSFTTVKIGLSLRWLHIRAFEPRREKTNILVSDLVRHKLGYTAA